jgi:hypothetical protein
MSDSELRDLRYDLGNEDSIHVDCLDAGETFQVCESNYNKNGTADLFPGHIPIF